jgi:HlyD family secretion protein
MGAAAAVVIASLLLAAPSAERWANATISVPYDRIRTATVTRGDLVRDVSVQGRVVAAVSPTLYATNSGTITLHVEAGEQVVAGQVLATVESPDLASALQQAESALDKRKMELERQRIESKQQALEKRKAADAASYHSSITRKRRTTYATPNWHTNTPSPTLRYSPSG